MPHRFILYDALKSLSRGHHLATFSETSFLQHLEGCPEVHVVTEKLIKNGWVRSIDEHENFYEITEEGQRVFEEGHEQYKHFPWYKKLFGRPLLLRW